jgi:hypothetical protein
MAFGFYCYGPEEGKCMACIYGGTMIGVKFQLGWLGVYAAFYLTGVFALHLVDDLMVVINLIVSGLLTLGVMIIYYEFQR